MAANKSSTSKLSDAFGVEDEEISAEMSSVEVPENPTIDDIVRFALTSFKDIIDDTNLTELKFRARNLEVGSIFLKIAQDALIQKKDMDRKDRELLLKEKMAETKKNPTDFDEEEDARETFLEKMKKDKPKK